MMFRIICLTFSLFLVQQVVAEGDLTLIKFKELFDPHAEGYSFESTDNVVRETLRLQEGDPTRLTNEEANDLSNLVEACNIKAEYCTPNLDNEYAELMAGYKDFPSILSYMSECEMRQKKFCQQKHIANPNWPNEGPEDWKEDHYIVYAREGKPIGRERTLEKMNKLLELYRDRTDQGSISRREKIENLVALSQFDQENCEPRYAYQRREIFRYNSAFTVNLVPYMKYWLDLEHERCSRLVFEECDLESINILDNEMANITETDKKAARKMKVKAIFAHLMWKARAELDPNIKYASLRKEHYPQSDGSKPNGKSKNEFSNNYRSGDDEDRESKRHKKCAAANYKEFENFVYICRRKLEMKRERNEDESTPFIGEKACQVILEDLEAISKDVYDAVQMRKAYCRLHPRLKYRYGKINLSKYFKSDY